MFGELAECPLNRLERHDRTHVANCPQHVSVLANVGADIEDTVNAQLA